MDTVAPHPHCKHRTRQHQRDNSRLSSPAVEECVHGVYCGSIRFDCVLLDEPAFWTPERSDGDHRIRIKFQITREGLLVWRARMPTALNNCRVMVRNKADLHRHVAVRAGLLLVHGSPFSLTGHGQDRELR